MWTLRMTSRAPAVILLPWPTDQTLAHCGELKSKWDPDKFFRQNE